MLSDDPAMATGRVQVELFSHEVAEAGTVQVGARADDAMTWETAQLPSDVGQDVHWEGAEREMIKNSSALVTFTWISCTQQPLLPPARTNLG